jgi:hypothetical protein
MAFELIEGFDLVGSNADLIAKGFSYTDGTLGGATGKFGGAGYSLATNDDQVLSKNVAFIEYNTLSCWFKTGTLTASHNIMGLENFPSGADPSNNTQSYVATDASGRVVLLSGGVTRATSVATGVIHPSTWHHIELRTQLNNLGSAAVYVDGLLVLESLAADFYVGANSSSPILYGNPSVNIFDDVVLQTSDSALPPVLGPHKIHTLLPNADTAQADWTGSYTDVDDPFGSSDADATYISTATLNNKSEFSLGDLPESPATIHAVQSVIEARKTDAGTKGVTQHIDSNGTEEAGTEFAAAETYGMHTALHPLNPDGGVAWTEASINALLIGVEITT